MKKMTSSFKIIPLIFFIINLVKSINLTEFHTENQSVQLNYTVNITKTEKRVECNNDNDCKNKYTCNITSNICIYTGMFPLSFKEIIFFPLIGLNYGMAILSGVGGGIFANSILLWIERFSTSEAIPITMAVMSISSIYTFYLGVKFKKENPYIDFIDYKFASIIIPMILFGCKFGSILNFIFPFVIPSIILIYVVSQATISIYSKYKSTIKKENDSLLEREEQIKKEIETYKNGIRMNNKKIYSSDLMTKNIENRGSLHNQDLFNSYSTIENIFSKDSYINSNMEKLQNLIELDNDPFPEKWRNSLIITFSIYLLSLLIEGSRLIPSIIGISQCSIIYWFLLIFSGFGFLYLSIYNREKVRMEFLEKKELDITYSNTREEQISDLSNKNIYIFGFFTGALSSFIGIGGGVILTPYMLNMGFSPKMSTSTINLLIIFLSASSSITFLLIGSLYFSFVLVLSIPTIIGCYICSSYVNNYIKKTGKQSFLLLSLLIISIVSIAFMLLSTKNKLYAQYLRGEILKFEDYCID